MWYLAAFLFSVWLIGFWPTIIIIVLFSMWAINEENDWFGPISKKLDPIRSKLGLKTRAQKLAEDREMMRMGSMVADHINRTGQGHKLREYFEENEEKELNRKNSKKTRSKKAAATAIGAVAGYKTVRAKKPEGLTSFEKSEISRKERELRSQINSSQSMIDFCTFNLTQNRGAKKDADYRAKIASETAKLSTLNAELSRLPKV